MTILSKITAGATVALAAAVLAATHTSVAAVMKPSPAAGGISQGKALVSTYRCNGCHGADLMGKPGFSPSLHRSGVLKEYSLKTFARVLLTGVTANGGHVHPPMPVYGMMRPMGRLPHGGPHPGGMPPPPGGPPPGHMGGMHHGGMHGPPPPMKASQAVAIYTYLRTLP